MALDDPVTLKPVCYFTWQKELVRKVSFFLARKADANIKRVSWSMQASSNQSQRPFNTDSGLQPGPRDAEGKVSTELMLALVGC